MQSLTYAVRFIRASFSLASKKSQIQRSWLYLGIGSLLALIIWFLPLAIVVYFLGLQPVAMMLVGLICVFALISLLVLASVFALTTCRTFSTIDNDGEDQKTEQSLLPERWFDAALLALSLPGEQVRQTFQQIISPEASGRSPWLDTSYLILPVICLENLSLSQAVERVKQIVGEHLLRFRADLVRVRLVAGVVQWVLMAGGIILGFILGISLADPASAGNWQRVLGAGAGMILAWLPIMIGLVFGTFTRTIYHTALYQWVKNVETSRQTQARDQASPPEILRRVLGKQSSSNPKER